MFLTFNALDVVLNNIKAGCHGYLQPQPIPHVLNEVGGVLAVVELFGGVNSVSSRRRISQIIL